MRRAFTLTALAAVAIVAFACPPAEAKKVKIPVAELRPPEPSAPESLAYNVDDLPYRVAPGDRIDVDFGVQLDGKPLRAENLLVRPDGMITLNPVGDVRAAGLTTEELGTELTGRYVDVFREPRVTVGIRQMAGNFVHVFGEVRTPGSYEVMPNATVMQAIARAGGTTNDAALGNVVLMRRTGPSSLVARKVQIDRAISQGLAESDPYVRRFDIVYVPRTRISSVNRFVEQFFTNLTLPMAQSYIFGWEAFNIDRVFPIQVAQPRP